MTPESLGWFPRVRVRVDPAVIASTRGRSAVQHLDVVARLGYIPERPQLEDVLGKTATARARIEPDVKEEAERILDECGLTASEAIGLFYRQVILRHGLPFPVQNFNDGTRKVLRKSERGVEVRRFDSAEALFEDLGI